MTDTTISEGTLTTPDGHELYTKTWKPQAAQVKARIVFIHGFSDHCNCYGPLFPLLAQQGIAVHSLDQRGWGRSVHAPAEKGRTGPTSQVMADITTFTQSVLTEQGGNGLPLFLMGHSMGGAEVLVYAATGPKEVASRFRGFLVESPFVALHPHTRPWSVTVVLGRLAGKLLPHMHMVNKLDVNKLSRDPEVCRAVDEDPLCHDTGTLEGLAGMLDRADVLESGKVVVKEGLGEGGKTRLWVGHGTADSMCDYQACRKWYEGTRVEDKEMRVYEGWYHKLHAEPGEDSVSFAEDVAKWVLDRCRAPNEVDSTGSRPKL